MEDLELRAKKRFGQHFLASPEVVRRIAGEARSIAAPGILEIGPGGGALTGALLAEGRPLWAMELDAEALAVLRARFANELRFHLLAGNAVTAPLPAEGGPWAVVGNLPYNAATAILTRFLLEAIPWAGMVLMFQLEVGQKLLGRPGQKAYGPLSVLAQLCARMHRVCKLGPGAFHPPPNVDSVVLRFDPRDDAPPHPERGPLLEVLHACFAHRRKTLANNLQPRLPGLSVESLLRELGIAPRERAEALPPEGLLALHRELRERGLTLAP